VAEPDDRKSTMLLLREAEPEDLIKFGLIPSSSAPAGGGHAGRAGRGGADQNPRRAEERADQAVPEDVPDGRRRARDPRAGVARDLAQGARRKTGARGLRSILEHTLLDVMYDLPSLGNLTRVIVDEATIANDGKPLLMYADPPKVASAKS